MNKMSVSDYKILIEKGKKFTKNIEIKDDLIEKLIYEFMPEGIKLCKLGYCEDINCESRCSHDYWIDHGELTKKFMEFVATRINKDVKLYGQVGLIHDIDYLMYPHDIKGQKEIHPVPLVNKLSEHNIHPAIQLAILEHAAYLKFYKTPTSRLSATLSACEDLATLVSIRNNEEYIKQLSDNAIEISKKFEAKKFIDLDKEKPRVIQDVDKYINQPLELAFNMRVDFQFDI